MELSIAHYKGTHSEISELIWLLNMALITNSADSDEMLLHFNVFTVCLTLAFQIMLHKPYVTLFGKLGLSKQYDLN